MPIRTDKDKLGLRRAVYGVELLVSDALDAISKSWTERLLPSLEKEHAHLEKWAEELEQEKASIPDDFLTDDYAVIEETQHILRALLTVGVYHVFEQHLVRFFYSWAQYYQCKAPEDRKPTVHPTSCGCKPLKNPQLSDVVDSFKKAWAIDLTKLTSYPKINDELRLVANCVKHGEGGSCLQLEALHKDWFDPDHGVTPLSAHGLQIPADYLGQAVESVKSFLNELKAAIDSAPTQA